MRQFGHTHTDFRICYCPSRHVSGTLIRLIEQHNAVTTTLAQKMNATQKYSWICILLIALILHVTNSSSAYSYQSDIENFVRHPITMENYLKYKYLFSSLNKDVQIEEISIYETNSYHVLRVNNENFCLSDKCLTFVVLRCNKCSCPHTTALVVDRFKTYFLPTISLGEVITFPNKNPECSTAILINQSFVVATQGL